MRTSRGERLRYLNSVVLPYDGDECLIWPYNRVGGGYADITIDGQKKYVHRVVCERAHGEPPTPEHHAAHSCGKGHEACVTKRHLFWKTPAENNADKVGHGTHIHGEMHSGAKLTEEDVREIRALCGTIPQQEIAQQFGISQKAVSLIHLRVNWRRLD